METERTDAQKHRNTETPTHKNTDAQTHQSTDVRLTIVIPQKLYEAICLKAAKEKVRKKEVIVRALNIAASGASFNKDLVKDVHTSIDKMLGICKSKDINDIEICDDIDTRISSEQALEEDLRLMWEEGQRDARN